MKKFLKQSLLATVLLTTGTAAGVTYLTDNKYTEEIEASDVSYTNRTTLSRSEVEEAQAYTNGTYENDFRDSLNYQSKQDSIDEAKILIEDQSNEFTYASERLAGTPDPWGPGFWEMIQDGTILDQWIIDWKNFLDAWDAGTVSIEDWVTDHDGSVDISTIDEITEIDLLPQTDLGLSIIDVHDYFHDIFTTNVSDLNETDHDGVTLIDSVVDYWANTPKTIWPYMVAAYGSGTGDVDEQALEIQAAMIAYVNGLAEAQWLVKPDMPDQIIITDVLVDFYRHLTVEEIAAFVDSHAGMPDALPVNTNLIEFRFPDLTWTDIPHISSIYSFPGFDKIPTAPFADGEYSTQFINNVNTKVDAAIDAAVDPITQPTINAMFKTQIHAAIDGPIATLADNLEDKVNDVIMAVADIETKIIALNAKIDQVNALVHSYNDPGGYKDQWNQKILDLNAAWADLITNINTALAGADLDWDEIVNLTNGLNALIDEANKIILEVNILLAATINELNNQIEAQFGKLSNFYDYTNDAISLAYNSVYFSMFNVFAELYVWENETDLFPPEYPDGVLTNKYQDSIFRNGTTHYDDDGLAATPDLVSKYPFQEVSITSSDGATTVPVDMADPTIAETPTETYDLTYTISARDGSGADADTYIPFAYDEIKIYDQTGAELTYTATKGATPIEAGVSVANGTTYDIYEYTYVIEDLNAGQEYSFYMEPNHYDPAAKAYGDTYADFFEGFNNSIKVNETPVIHYVPNTINYVADSATITEVSATGAEFLINNGGTAWDVEQTDITINTYETDDTAYVTPVGGATITGFETDATDPTLTKVTADLGTGLTPYNENIDPFTGRYTTVMTVSSYDGDVITDDGTWSTDTFKWDWQTLPWKAPLAPTKFELFTESATWLDTDNTDYKHSANIDYTIDIPGVDELTGQDTTKLTSLDLYLHKEGEDYSTPVITVSDFTNGQGASDDATATTTETGTITLDTTSMPPGGLELGTTYYATGRLNYEGLHAGPDTNVYIDSNEVTFVTEGLDPALPPFFGLESDTTDGITFVEGEQTTTSASIDFAFTDPGTPVDTDNTIIDPPVIYVGTKADGSDLTETTDFTITYDDGVGPVSDDNLTDIEYTGNLQVNGLNPNTVYYFRMDLDSNSRLDIHGDPDDTITVESPVVTGKTLKEAALPPVWDTTVPFEFASDTSTNILMDFKFEIPADDMIHKNTRFDGLNVYRGTTSGDLALLTPDDYTITYDSSCPGADATTGGYGPGVYTGQVDFINLEANTTYFLQLGIKSHSYDDDYPTETPNELAEVLSPERELTTDKAPAIDPWWDTTTGGLEYIDSYVAAVDVGGTPENQIEATFSYKFYTPTHDDDTFDTIFRNVEIYSKSTFAGESEYSLIATITEDTSAGTLVTTDTDAITIEETAHKVTDSEVTDPVAGVATGDEWSGIITLHDLHPEENYSIQARLNVYSEDENPLKPGETLDGDAIDPMDPVDSNEITFKSAMLPPKPPFWGDESDDTDGLEFVKTGDGVEWTDTKVTYQFEFTVPAKEHGYTETLVDADGLNVYAGTSEDSLSLVDPSTGLGGVTYVMTPNAAYTPNADGTWGAGTYAGKIVFSGLTANTTYYVQLGLDSNYYLGADSTALVEVMTPVVEAKTSKMKAVEPTIDYDDTSTTSVNEEGVIIAFNKDKSRYEMDIDINMFNGTAAGESDEGDNVADALIKEIHVGKAETDADGNVIYEADGETIKMSDVNYYYPAPYKPGDTGAGVEKQHYELSIQPLKLPFESTITDMVVTVDWEDDGTSYEVSSGSFQHLVPEFDTPDIEVMVAQMEVLGNPVTTTSTAEVSYNLKLMDPPDGDGSTSLEQVEEPEVWQSVTRLKRITVEGPTGTMIEFSSPASLINNVEGYKGLVKEDEMYYDSDSDTEFEGSEVPQFGKVTVDGLNWGYLYQGLKISAEYDSVRQNDATNPDADLLEQPTEYVDNGWIEIVEGTDGKVGRVSAEIPAFETETVSTITPGLDPDDKPVVELPIEPPGVGEGNHNPDGGWPTVDPVEPEKPEVVDPDSNSGDEANKRRIIWLILLILFTGITVIAILYPMLTRD